MLQSICPRQSVPSCVQVGAHNSTIVAAGRIPRFAGDTFTGVHLKGVIGGKQTDFIAGVKFNFSLDSIEYDAAIFAGLDNTSFHAVDDYRRCIPSCIAPAIRDVQLEHLRIKFLVEELNIEVEHPSPARANPPRIYYILAVAESLYL